MTSIVFNVNVCMSCSELFTLRYCIVNQNGEERQSFNIACRFCGSSVSHNNIDCESFLCKLCNGLLVKQLDTVERSQKVKKYIFWRSQPIKLVTLQRTKINSCTVAWWCAWSYWKHYCKKWLNCFNIHPNLTPAINVIKNKTLFEFPSA